MEKQTKKRLSWILGTFLGGVFLMFFGQYFELMGFIGLLLAILGPLISLYLVKPSQKEIEASQRIESKRVIFPSQKIRTSQKVAMVGTICLFLSIPLFFIFWPIGLILLIVAFVCMGSFYGFQSTEKAEDFRKMREILEEKKTIQESETTSKAIETYQETEIKLKKKSRKWLWILLGIILFSVIISLGSEKGEEIGPAQVSQPQAQSQPSAEVKELVKLCKEGTIEKYGTKDKFFFCGCYCGLFVKYPDILGQCMEECVTGFETIWASVPLESSASQQTTKKSEISSSPPSTQQKETQPVQETQPTLIPGLDQITVSDASGYVPEWLGTGFTGVKIEIIYWNKYLEIISSKETAKVPITADVRLFTSESYGKKGRLIYSGNFSSEEIEVDYHYPVLKIPKEKINVIRGVDSQYGIAEVTIYTPNQGSFSTTDNFISLWD